MSNKTANTIQTKTKVVIFDQKKKIVEEDQERIERLKDYLSHNFEEFVENESNPGSRSMTMTKDNTIINRTNNEEEGEKKSESKEAVLNSENLTLTKTKQTKAKKRKYIMPIKRKSYDPNQMRQAVEAIKNDTMTVAMASKEFGITHATLYDKLSGRSPIVSKIRTFLTPEAEDKIVEWIKTSARHGFEQTNQSIKVAVQQALNADGRFLCRRALVKDMQPGRTWYRLFMKRHPDLKKWISPNRKIFKRGGTASESSLRDWYKRAERDLSTDAIDLRNIEARCVFNCDGSHFMLKSNDEVIFTEASPKYPKSKQQISVLGCASASGQVLYPIIIFPGDIRYMNQQKLQFPEAEIEISSNGLISRDLFTKWLLNFFVPSVKDLPKPVLLFADGKFAHYNEAVSNICMENCIRIFIISPIVSQTVQPLDLIFHNELKSAWTGSDTDYTPMNNNMPVMKHNFAGVFKDAWERAYNPNSIIESFRASGIHPWNPNVLEYSMLALKPVDTQNSSSQKPSAGHVFEAKPAEENLIQDRDNECDDAWGTDAPQDHDYVYRLELQDGTKTKVIVENLPQETVSLLSSHPPTDSIPQCTTSRPQSFSSHQPEPEIKQFHLKTPIQQQQYPDNAQCPRCSCNTVSNTRIPESQLLMQVDKLMSHVITSRWNEFDLWAYQRRLNRNEEPGETETAYRTFKELYSRLNPFESIDYLPIPHEITENYFLMHVEKLLSLVVTSRWNEFELWANQQRLSRNEEPKPNETDYRIFKELYEKLAPFLSTDIQPIFQAAKTTSKMPNATPCPTMNDEVKMGKERGRPKKRKLIA